VFMGSGVVHDVFFGEHRVVGRFFVELFGGLADGAFDGDEVDHAADGVIEEAKAGIAVAVPVDGEFADVVAMLLGAEDDFDVEHEAFGGALLVEESGDVAAVQFEAALGIGDMVGYTHEEVDESAEDLGADASMGQVFVDDMAAVHSAGGVGEVAVACF